MVQDGSHANSNHLVSQCRSFGWVLHIFQFLLFTNVFQLFEFILSCHRLFSLRVFSSFSRGSHTIQNYYWTNEETLTRNWWMLLYMTNDRNSRVTFPILCQLMDTICVCVEKKEKELISSSRNRRPIEDGRQFGKLNHAVISNAPLLLNCPVNWAKRLPIDRRGG